MGKAELQSDINGYQNIIDSNNYEIEQLKVKIENIEEEIGKREVSIGVISSFYENKRNKFSGVDLTKKGKAAINFVRKNLELYSSSEESSFENHESNIIYYFQDNIGKLEERIYELEYENNNYDRLITECNNEIANIEREEAEQATKKTTQTGNTTKSKSGSKKGGSIW